MLYTILKTLAVGYSSGNMPFKDETVVKLSRVKRWQEHFCSILNRLKPENTAPIFEIAQNVDINTELKSIQEIKTIRGMKTTSALNY